MTLTYALNLTTLVITFSALIAYSLVDFDVQLTPFFVSAVISVVLWSVAYIYTYWRPHQQIATTAQCVAYLMFVSPSIGLVSYAMVSLNLPLIDAQLAAWDAAMGFDWLAFLAFSADYPWFTKTMTMAYHSSGPLLIAAFFILSFFKHDDHLKRFLLTYAWTVFIVVVTAGLLPAIGAYEYYQPASELKVFSAQAGVWHLDHFNALRDGTYDQFRLSEIEGLVTFPSFHTTLALLTVWCYWPLRWLRWPILVLNIFVLLGTVLEGGHHVIDMVVGAGLAFVAIAVARRLTDSAAPQSQPSAVPVAAAPSPAT